LTIPQALALGVLQGATEFLPVSSSGHLALAEHLISGGERPALIFDIVLHLATLLAIVLVLRERLFELIRAALSYFWSGEADENTRIHRRWIWLLAAASVPTALIGLSMRDVVGDARLNPSWIGAALLVTAALLVVTERAGARNRGPGDLGIVDAIWIGTAQGLAVMPGISRSGSTIAAAITRGTDSRTAVEFSMLVSIPAILGANVLELSQGGGMASLESDLVPFGVGFVAAFVTGFLSLKALQWLVERRHLLPFAVYCTLLGLGVIALG